MEHPRGADISPSFLYIRIDKFMFYKISNQQCGRLLYTQQEQQEVRFIEQILCYSLSRKQ